MQEKILRVTDQTIIVGIDIAKKEHWARITDYRGVDLTKPVKVKNSEDSFERLMARIEKLRIESGCDKVIIGLEPSGHYWKPLGWYLYLHLGNPILVGVNPYHTKQAKELDDNSQTKSDKKDAMTIAHWFGTDSISMSICRRAHTRSYGYCVMSVSGFKSR